MATGFKQTPKRLLVNSASAGITSNTITAQEGFFGVALKTVTTGQPVWIGIEGVWNIAVPASTVKGDFLYIPGANGAVTEAAAPTLTRTGSNANSPVAKAVTARDAVTGYADVLILAQGAAKAATQV